MTALIPIAVFAVVLLIIAMKSIVVVPNGQVYVIERLGRVHRRITEGIAVLTPFIDRVAEKYALDAEPVPIDVQVISRDNVTLRITGSATYRIEDVTEVHKNVADVPSTVAQLLRTAFIAEAGKRTVTEMREETRSFRSDVQKAASQLGIEIVAVEAGVAR